MYGMSGMFGMYGEDGEDARPEAGGGEPSAREAARLRYELARLRDRRTVRAALAAGELRRAGFGPAWAALRGRAPRLDVPGPAVVPLRGPFPHLRAVHTGAGHLLTSTCAHEWITPATVAALLRRDRPDLVLVDGVTGWSSSAFEDLRELAREAGTPVVTVGPTAASAFPDADLRVAAGVPVAGADLDLGARVDVRRWSPGGLDDAVPPHRRADAVTMSPTDAHAQPVVVVEDVSAVGTGHCLALLSAGAVLVTGPDDGLAHALGPLAGEVVGAADDLEERAAALLADDDRRRRVSVRLRRRVHAGCSTRAALVAIVSRLGIDAAPPQRISVLLATRRPDRLAQVVEDLAGQTHPDVELVLLPHGDAPLPEQLIGTLSGEVRVERVPAERPLGAVLNAGLDLATGQLVAKVDDDDRYGRDHLGDQLLALWHSGADLVGKRVHGVYDESAGETIQPPPGGEERYEDHVPGGTLLLPALVLRSLRWRHVPKAVDTELVRAVHLAGGSVYSTHRYGYVRIRHGDHLYEPDVAWTGGRVPGLDESLLDA